MIKIITAMNNPKINDELKNEKNIELSIENLNDIKEVKRLKKEDITDKEDADRREQLWKRTHL